jgi:4-amino-4-deoxy-L-arabinose transferase-like glycosyltransferase
LIQDQTEKPKETDLNAIQVAPIGKDEGKSLLIPRAHFFPVKAILPAIGSFALAIHLIFLVVLPSRWTRNESTDYFLFYEPVAHNLVEGHGLVAPDGSAALRYPPGHPFVLASLIKSARLTRLPESLVFRAFIVLVVMILPILIYGIAVTFFEHGVALLGAVLFATYPFYLWLTKQLNSEIPFLFLFFLALYRFFRTLEARRPTAWHGLAIGALIGMASLVRPIIVFLSAGLLFALWLCQKHSTARQKLLFSALLLLGNVLAVLPWELWARAKTGEWILLSSNGPPSILDGLTFGVKDGANANALPLSPEVAGLMREVRDHRKQLQTVSAIGGFLASQFREKPVIVTKLIVLKMSRALYANDSQSFEGWVALVQVPYLLFALVGVIRATKSGRGQQGFVFCSLIVVSYFWCMTTVGLSILRYMVPAIGLLMPFVSSGIVAAARMFLQPLRPSVSIS